MNRILCENSALYKQLYVFTAFAKTDYFILPTTFYLNLENIEMDSDLERTLYDTLYNSNNLMSRKKHLVLNFRKTKTKEKELLFVKD